MHNYKKVTVIRCKDAIVRTKLYENVCYFLCIFIHLFYSEAETGFHIDFIEHSNVVAFIQKYVFSPLQFEMTAPPPYIKHISTRQHSLALCVHLCIGTQYLRRQSFLAPLMLSILSATPPPTLAFPLPLWIYIAKQCINNVQPQRRLSPLSFSLFFISPSPPSLPHLLSHSLHPFLANSDPPYLLSFLLLVCLFPSPSSHSVCLNVCVCVCPLSQAGSSLGRAGTQGHSSSSAAERNSPSKNRPVGLTNRLPLSFRLLSQRETETEAYSVKEKGQQCLRFSIS